MTNIRDEIIVARRAMIAARGHTGGSAVPDRRTVPLVRFGADPFVVCEIKRRSPSRGDLAPVRDAAAVAGTYARYGARSISVLTESEYFGGSLDDLITVKSAHPELSVLRKDFLFDEQDIEVSYRAGADAVLLIASCLPAEQLAAMHARATGLGMRALVELHDEADVEKARAIAPELVGINSRDLTTFRIDLLGPLVLRPSIDWPCEVVFESGLFTEEHAAYAKTSGFDGVLVGEAVVTAPERIPAITEGVSRSRVNTRGRFWARIGDIRRRYIASKRPIIKICGITHRDDAEHACELGADALGFVFARSPRKADLAVLRTIRDLSVLKIGVTVIDAEHPELDPDVRTALSEGLIDAVQFHGDEAADECFSFAFPYYKAVRVRSDSDVATIRTYRSPRVLVDAYDPSRHGGTGKEIDPGLVSLAAELQPLWLAGGIGPHNVRRIIRDFSPELIDASSSLEETPGKKSREALAVFFKEVENAGII